MSDRIAVMDKGRIQQLGSPTELYHAPNSSFVADFIGKMNFLEGVVHTIDDTNAEIVIAGETIAIPRAQVAAGAEFRAGQQVRIAARPESITVTGIAAGAIRGRIETSVFLGSHRTLIVRADDGTQLQVQVASSNRDPAAPEQGRTLLALDTTAVRLFPREG